MTSPAQFITAIKTEKKAPGEQVRVQRIDESARKVLPYIRRDYYKIWITIHPGEIHYATKTISLTKPALIFSNPRVPYAFESSGLGGGYMCIFTEEFLVMGGRSESLQESPLFKAGSNPVFFLGENLLKEVSEHFDKMIAELESSYVFRYDAVRNRLNLIIHEALKMEPAAGAVRYHNASERIVSLFLELLERQFPIDSPSNALQLRKPADYAKQLSVHVNHLNQVLREATGKPTSALINDRIIAEAKAMLLRTDLTIAEIAYCLGFEYPSYFNNFFRRLTGTTPLSMRK